MHDVTLVILNLLRIVSHKEAFNGMAIAEIAPKFIKCSNGSKLS